MPKTAVFSRFFKRKPRLDHPRADRRIEALDSMEHSEQSVFLTVARDDDDLEVRATALKKLTAVDDLSQFLDDSDLATEALELVCAQIDTQHSLLSHTRVRNYMLGRIESGEQLAEVAQKQTSTEEIAETIFCAQSTAVRQEAVALISNMAVLNYCERISRNKDKSVNRYIRDRLAEAKRLQASRDDALNRAEQLVDSATRANASDSHYASLREAQEKSWEAVLGELGELNTQLKAFGIEKLDLEILRTRFPRRTTALNANETDPHRFAEIIAALKTAPNQQDALDEAEQAWLKELRVQKAPIVLSNEFFDLTGRIRSAQKHDAVRDRLAARFAKLTAIELALPDTKVNENWSVLWTVRKRAKDHHRDVERFLEFKDFLDLDTKTQSGWREQLQKVATHCESIVQRSDELFDATQKTIEESFPTLAEKLQEGALQQALTTERQIRSSILRLPEGARKRQFDTLAPLSVELRQLLNWKTFATQPKREELCVNIESLRETPLPPQEQFDQIRSLRAEWNALGPPSTRDEVDLQKRYDDAADGAWRICAEWFEAQKQVRMENANHKEALARELENYIEDINWQEADWRAVQQLLTQHLKKFKEIGDADRSRSRTINKRFFGAYQTIRDHLVKHREGIGKTKEELIAKAREVCEDESMADQERLNAIKGLQAEWKSVGATFHKVEERLWSEFRTLCNSVFENRQMQRDDRKATITKDIDQAKDVVAKLLSRARASKSKFDVSAVKEVEALLTELVLPVRIRNELDRKLAQVDDILADRKQAALYTQVSERFKVLLEKDAELAGYETNNSPIPVAWYDAVQNDMVWFESRAPLNDDSVLRDIVLRTEIQADIEAASTEDGERRLQLRVGDLATTMGRAETPQKDTVERLIRDWVGAAHGEQPLRERFNRAMSVLVGRLSD